MGFKKDFVWGAATAAYQIEGAAYEDGKSLSIWDMYCKGKGNIFSGHTGDVACDHYHRYKEDVAIMKEMGLKAYRFSVSWPRVIPNGTGEVNQKGLDFYSDLVDELIRAGIEPYITFYHWDLPYELHKRGGWLNPDSPDWFAEYVTVVTRRLSDRVKNFITFNEPQGFIGMGYGGGKHAPGLKNSLYDRFIMAHNVLLAHGNGVLACRAASPGGCKIGYAPTARHKYPATESKADIDAARRAMFEVSADINEWYWGITWWSDPVYLGKYPDDGMELYKEHLPKIGSNDMKIINQPLDFVGQNLYYGTEIKDSGDGGYETVPRYEGFPKTAINWNISPKSIKWCAKFLYERYKLPIMITENGMSCHDVISLDGKVHDPNREDFIHRYLKSLQEAADEGVDIAGYFQWSLMDNFEWAHGYNERFGMIYVDYPTQKRIIKDSAYFYKKVIETNGSIL